MSISANAMETLSAELGPGRIFSMALCGGISAGRNLREHKIERPQAFAIAGVVADTHRDGDQSKDRTPRRLAVSNDQFAGAHAIIE
jgi:hypothetical protein